MKLKPMTGGLYMGLLIAGFHFLWSLIVALGLGQIYLDWILGLHFIKNPFIVNSFDIGTMVMLLIVTFAVGFVIGWVATLCWNKMMKNRK